LSSKIANGPDILNRGFQFLLILSTLCISWLGMMVVHEFGHVVSAWLSGGIVARGGPAPAPILAHRTASESHPLFVAWGGPVIGVCASLSHINNLALQALARLGTFCSFLQASASLQTGFTSA